MHSKRVILPLLSLIATIVSFALVMLCGLVKSSFVILLFGQMTPLNLLPRWLHYFLSHPVLLKTLARAGLGFSVLSAVLTLYLLLRTELPNTASKHLAGIGWVVLLMTGGIVGPVVLFAGISVYPTLFPHHNFGSWSGIGSFLGYMLSIYGPATLLFGALVFVVSTMLSSLIKIWGRLKTPAPAQAPDSVLQ